MVYFDNAATTQMSEVAIKALLDVSKNNYGNASAIYSYGKESKEILSKSREIIANAIGAKSTEVYFTSCGTESDNWAIAQARTGKYQKIITSNIEHHAILNAVRKLEFDGYEVNYVTSESNGVISSEALKKILGSEKTLVSLMLQNNETGIIQPIQEFAEIVHSKNAESVVHTDAVQAVGHIPINVKDLGIDMLSASAHKFNGPKGVGFLYVREGIEMSPLIYGGGQEKELRSGTENVAGIYAMAKALEENIMEISENSNKAKLLELRLLQRLDMDNIAYEINGDVMRKAPGIINIAFNGADGEALLNALDSQGICISTGSACNSVSKERSYVLSAMKLGDDRIDSSIRISIGRYNTDKEVELLAKSISRYVKLVEAVSE